MKIYLVGGAVRDELLGLQPHDKDWVVTGSTFESMINQGFKCIGRSFPVFLHPQTKQEYALARTEKSSGKGGHTGFSVNFNSSVTLREDLLRRDLTINAIARRHDGTYVDPFNGIQDLIAKRFRHVSPAFSDDPLRLLRVARFASCKWAKAFRVDPTTILLMKAISKELLTLSSERIWIELERALSHPYPHRFFEIMGSVGALNVLMPECLKILHRDRIHPIVKKGFAAYQESMIRYAQIGYWCSECTLGPSIGLDQFNNLERRIGTPKSFKYFSQWLFLLPHYSLESLYEGDPKFWLEKFQAWGCWRKPEDLMIFLKLLLWRAQVSFSLSKTSFKTLKATFDKILAYFFKLNAVRLNELEIAETLPIHRQDKLLKKRIDFWQATHTAIFGKERFNGTNFSVSTKKL